MRQFITHLQRAPRPFNLICVCVAYAVDAKVTTASCLRLQPRQARRIRLCFDAAFISLVVTGGTEEGAGLQKLKYHTGHR